MSVFSVLADILFVGHSLVGPTLPVMLDAALNQMNEPSQVQAQIINGASLAYNWDHAAGAEGVDAKARLAERPTDVLILTEAQPVVGAVKWSDSAGYAALGVSACPALRGVIETTGPQGHADLGDRSFGDQV